MSTKMVIYMPHIIDTSVQARLRAGYPAAEFVTHWRDGAIMWQDALARLST